MRSLSIYFFYFLQFLKNRLSYRADFFAGIVANMFATLGGIIFILFLMDGKNVTDLRGWKREEVLFIYGFSMCAMAIFSTVAINLYNFADKYIIQGQFDRVLLRPLNSLCQVIFESFNLDSVGSLAVGLFVMFYSAAALEITFAPIDILWLLISSISGGIILISVFIFLSSLSFHFEDRLGIAPPFYNLINFARYPLPIFNNLIQFILKWVVPFAFVAFYPATHFLGKPEFRFFCYFTPVMALICLAIAGLMWRLGVSRYASTGS